MTGSSDTFFSMHQPLNHIFCYSMDTRLEVVRLAASNGVIMFALPPRTTHVAQPLDVTSSHALKTTGIRSTTSTRLKYPERS